jgi:hypothetical protein
LLDLGQRNGQFDDRGLAGPPGGVEAVAEHGELRLGERVTVDAQTGPVPGLGWHGVVGPDHHAPAELWRAGGPRARHLRRLVGCLVALAGNRCG